MRPGRSSGFCALLAVGALLIAPALAADYELPERLAITGARIHALSGDGIIERATILVEDGVIRALGPDGTVDLPNGTRWIEARGRSVTPGLVDAHGYLALSEPVRPVTVAGGADLRLGAALDVADALNPLSELVELARADGLTRAVVAPRPLVDRMVAGQGALIRLGSDADFLVQSPLALYAATGGVDFFAQGRATAMLELRGQLVEAREYLERGRSARRDGGRHLGLEAMAAVVSGEIPVVAHAHRASEIRALLRLAEEFNIRLVIAGGAEAWRVTPELARARVPVVLVPVGQDSRYPPFIEERPDNARRLHLAGIPFAFGTGDTLDPGELVRAAGNAVAHGLPADAALAAITINVAAIFGGGDGPAGLAPGAPGDLVLWDGDPLELSSFPDRVFINGREASLENRRTRLRALHMERGAHARTVYRPTP